jgi:hypothetical protein
MTVTLSPSCPACSGKSAGRWPDSDEDQLLDMADGWKGMREQFEGIRAEDNRSVQAAAAHNNGNAWLAFVTYRLVNIDNALEHWTGRAPAGPHMADGSTVAGPRVLVRPHYAKAIGQVVTGEHTVPHRVCAGAR